MPRVETTIVLFTHNKKPRQSGAFANFIRLKFVFKIYVLIRQGLGAMLERLGLPPLNLSQLDRVLNQ